MADEIEGVPHHVRTESLDGMTRLWVKDRHVDLSLLETHVLAIALIQRDPGVSHAAEPLGAEPPNESPDAGPAEELRSPDGTSTGGSGRPSSSAPPSDA